MKKKYLAIFATIIIMLMISTTIGSAVKVNDGVTKTKDELINISGEEKKIDYYGWTNKDRADSEWKRAKSDDEHLPSPSGKGARCNLYLDLFGTYSYIYYEFQLSNWDKTDSISNVELEVRFDADTIGLNAGPDLKVTDDDNSGSKNGENYKTVKKSMGSPDRLIWKTYKKDESGNLLETYVNSEGKIYFCILCVWGCHAMIEQLRLRWTIDNFKPNTPSINGPNPSNPTKNEEITFTASATDNDGDSIDEYNWKIDGNQKQETGSTLTVSIGSGGDHTVAVRAKDDNGAWSSWATKEFTVSSNVGPTEAYISGTSSPSAFEAETYTFSAKDRNKETLTFTIDWGNEVQTSSVSPDGDGECELSLKHTYTLKTSYSIRLTVKDSAGETDSDTLPIEVPKSKSVSSQTFNLLKILSMFPQISQFIRNIGL